MQEFLRQILDTEENVKTKIRMAAEEAGKIKSAADAQTQADLKTAREEAASLLQKTLTEKRVEFLAQKESQLKTLHEESDSFIAHNESIIEDLIRELTDVVCSSADRKKGT